MRKLLTLLIIISVMITAALVMAQDDTIADIVTTSAEAEEDAEFAILLAAVSTSEQLTEALSEPEAELTVFAPTDEAFQKFFELAEIDVEELLAQPDIVEAILLYHVVEGAVDAESVMALNGEDVPTLLGDFATVTIEISEDDAVIIVDATDLSDIGLLDADINPTVIEADIEASNGFIHVIDEVLLPSDEMLTQHFEMMDAMAEEDTSNEAEAVGGEDTDSP